MVVDMGEGESNESLAKKIIRLRKAGRHDDALALEPEVRALPDPEIKPFEEHLAASLIPTSFNEIASEGAGNCAIPTSNYRLIKHNIKYSLTLFMNEIDTHPRPCLTAEM